MPLDVPLATVFFDPLTDDISGLRVRHPAIQDIDPLRRRIADQFDTVRLRMALQPLSTEADLADLQLCLSQSS